MSDDGQRPGSQRLPHIHRGGPGPAAGGAELARAGLRLEQVADLVATDGSPATVAEQLRRQHSLLVERIERLQAVAATVHKTMEAHDMGIRLTPEEMLEVFGEHDPTEHAEEAKERWGETDAYQESQRRTSGCTRDDWLRIRQEGDAANEAFAVAMRAGHATDSPEAVAAAVAHREQISRWYYEVTPEVHQGLAQMYVADRGSRRRTTRSSPVSPPTSARRSGRCTGSGR